jgi:hypothetical protein
VQTPFDFSSEQPSPQVPHLPQVPQVPHLLELVTRTHTKLSPSQAAFKRHVQAIEQLQLRLEELDALAAKHLPPLRQKLDECFSKRFALMRELIFLLDAKWQQTKGFTAKQRQTMSDIAAQFAADLLEAQTPFSDGMEAVFERHAGMSFSEALRREEAALLREVQEAELNAGIHSDQATAGEDDATLDEQIAEILEAQAAEQAAQRAQAEADFHARRRNRSGKATKRELEAADATVTLKELYRKLSSALHPDREPNEAERKRKTGLMAEANAAYAAGNLLRLLQLQFQAQSSGDTSATAAQHMADDKLMRLNVVLKKQLAELKNRCEALEAQLRQDFGLPYAEVTEKRIETGIKARVSAERAALQGMGEEITRLSRDDRVMKAWLREQRRGAMSAD